MTYFLKEGDSMALSTFASIHIGSNIVSMKIYEINKKNGIKELDNIRHSIELGSQTYTTGFLTSSIIEELCNILSFYTCKMKEYDVCDYTACATSAMREAKNQILVINQIELRTGIKIKVLSNSEQRFLCYKALFCKEPLFSSLTEKGTLIVDVGSGSVQLSQYVKQTLITTQNIKLGSLRIRELLATIQQQTVHYTRLIEEYINNTLNNYETLFLQTHKIKYLIGFGDQMNEFIKLSKKISYSQAISRETFLHFAKELTTTSQEEVSKQLGISKEQACLLVPTVLIYQKLYSITKAESLYFSDISLCDGLVAEYAMNLGKIASSHNFDNDIIESAKQIAIRYHCDTAHSDNVTYIALKLFDCLKKRYGLTKRERLYLQIASILHDCGNYININEIPLNSYHIVMSTEIIGISQLEHELIANLIRYRTSTFPNYTKLLHGLEKDTYLILAKLTAILRLANALDQSHLQKLKEIKVYLQEEELIISSPFLVDLSLEQGLLAPNVTFFRKVYGIFPKIKQIHRSSL